MGVRNIIDEIANNEPITRKISCTQSKKYPTPARFMSGEIYGYLESDDLFRERIKKFIIRKQTKENDNE